MMVMVMMVVVVGGGHSKNRDDNGDNGGISDASGGHDGDSGNSGSKADDDDNDDDNDDDHDFMVISRSSHSCCTPALIHSISVFPPRVDRAGCLSPGPEHYASQSGAHLPSGHSLDGQSVEPIPPCLASASSPGSLVQTMTK